MLFMKLKENNIEVLKNVAMRNHTTIKIGGTASKFIAPTTEIELKLIIDTCIENNIKFFILGNGSNILFNNTFDGVVISMKNLNSELELQSDTTLKVSANIMLPTMANFLYKHELSGFEFAAGIPGTIGGSIYMNAGAYGGEISDNLVSINVLTKTGIFKTILKNELKFDYRYSTLQDSGDIILSAVFDFQKDEKENIKAKMDKYKTSRINTQPTNKPSAGSTFKRPVGHFAAKLIDECGLKGFAVNDVMISEKHAGFVINNGNATYDDFSKLINIVQTTVFDKTGIMLELENKII